jgi:hypothetical protein
MERGRAVEAACARGVLLVRLVPLCPTPGAVVIGTRNAAKGGAKAAGHSKNRLARCPCRMAAAVLGLDGTGGPPPPPFGKHGPCLPVLRLRRRRYLGKWCG